MVESTRSVSGFRSRLFIVIILVVSLVTVIGAVLTQQHLTRQAELEYLASVDRQAEAATQTRRVRLSVLAEICRDLAHKPRIHAALEDNAIDLLYPSAANELRQLTGDHVHTGSPDEDGSIQAVFYRFLDVGGQLIPPESGGNHGHVPPWLESQISLESLPENQQVGYFQYSRSVDDPEVVEVLAVPIVSLETLSPIAALLVAFPFSLEVDPMDKGAHLFGIQTGEALMGNGLDRQLGDRVRAALSMARETGMENPVSLIESGGLQYRLQVIELNEGSRFPEVLGFFLSSLAPLEIRQAHLTRGIVLAALVILLVAFIVASITSSKMSHPVEALAQASEEEHHQRLAAEFALETASQELERSARFSADASHQLKTPVAVMRAGLEELLVDSGMPVRLHDEVRSLINQTGRLTQVIEDLLLLSQLDAGRLELDLVPINLRLMVDRLVDDLSIIPDSEQAAVEVDVGSGLWVRGSESYTFLILHCLIENACKYNRPGGYVRIFARKDASNVCIHVGNTGKSISPEVQAHIFERFHRGHSGETVPGYGLGLNLSMELTRLHGGSIELLVSRDDWTEFRLRLNRADPDIKEDTAP